MFLLMPSEILEVLDMLQKVFLSNVILGRENTVDGRNPAPPGMVKNL